MMMMMMMIRAPIHTYLHACMYACLQKTCEENGRHGHSSALSAGACFGPTPPTARCPAGGGGGAMIRAGRAPRKAQSAPARDTPGRPSSLWGGRKRRTKHEDEKKQPQQQQQHQCYLLQTAERLRAARARPLISVTSHAGPAMAARTTGFANSAAAVPPLLQVRTYSYVLHTCVINKVNNSFCVNIIIIIIIAVIPNRRSFGLLLAACGAHVVVVSVTHLLCSARQTDRQQQIDRWPHKGNNRGGAGRCYYSYSTFTAPCSTSSAAAAAPRAASPPRSPSVRRAR